jgi:hypothetical protein
MPTLQEYCFEHIDAIRAYNQVDMAWDKYNRIPYLEIPHFAEAVAQIPQDISRAHIIDAFINEDYYLGFIMAMMWGNIGRRPQQRGNFTTTHAYQALNTNPVVIAARLGHIKQLIADDNIETAYTRIDRQYRISGVGESFFTKLLSFISESLEEPRNLLIYDRWTKLIHVHLMLDNDLKPNLYYSNNKIRSIALPNGASTDAGQEFSAYSNYCMLMSSLATELSTENNPISPFQLEGFLFGKPLTTALNKNNNNPRFWYRNNFRDQYLHLF